MRVTNRPARDTRLEMAATAVMIIAIIGLGVQTSAQQTPQQAGEHLGVADTFVRVATDEEGWVVVGYEIANDSVGKEWMLLDVGLTLTKGTEAQKITREDLKLVTPGHEVISLPTQEEFEKVRGSLKPLVKRDSLVGESINYFPPSADAPCKLQFFNDPGAPRSGMLASDEVELSSNRACLGRVYFQVPGGVQLGTYNFDVRFANSVVKVPIDIMTEEQAKAFAKQWKDAQEEAKHAKDPS